MISDDEQHVEDEITSKPESLKVRIPLNGKVKKPKRGSLSAGRSGRASIDRRPKQSSRHGRVAFPKHPLEKCIRIPQAVLDQNAGNDCTDREAAGFAKIGWTGDVHVEISSAIKYGLLERPSPGKVRPTDLARRVVRPQQPNDRTNALREAVLIAPVISDVYKRYRGENLPDREFLVNTVVDSHSVPKDRVDEFIDVFVQTLQYSGLLEEIEPGKRRVLDIVHAADGAGRVAEDQLKRLSKGVTVQATDTCFVVMPFAEPLGGYYTSIYQPAIERARLKAIRADAEIFGTGKIIDQIWSGIQSARILVAELTGRNPNVLYELGLAHALRKPVVLVSSNEGDVPFDVRHVRVIYYDVRDPFWGTKLIEKVAENILSALNNPTEAILFPEKK